MLLLTRDTHHAGIVGAARGGTQVQSLTPPPPHTPYPPGGQNV